MEKKLITVLLAACVLASGCGSVDKETDPEISNVSSDKNKEESDSQEEQENIEQSIIEESKAKLSD